MNKNYRIIHVRVYCSFMTVVTDLTTKITRNSGMNQVKTIIMKFDPFFLEK